MRKKEISHIRETTKYLIESTVSESILSKDMSKGIMQRFTHY